MSWNRVKNSTSNSTFRCAAFEQAPDKTAETGSQQVHKELWSGTAGIAWKEEAKSRKAAGSGTMDKYFGGAGTSANLPTEKSKKKEREFNDAPAKYAPGSSVEPERAEQRIAAQPRSNANRLPQEQARDVVPEHTMGSLTVNGVKQVASQAVPESKAASQSVPDHRGLPLSDPLHSSKDSSSLHDQASSERMRKETPTALSPNDSSHSTIDGRPFDHSPREAQSSHAGLNSETHHSTSEQSVLPSSERKASAGALNESSTGAHTAERTAQPSRPLHVETGAHTAEQSARPSLPPHIETPAVQPAAGPATVTAAERAGLSRTAPHERRVEEHVFADPKVLAKNDGGDIRGNTISAIHKPESAVRIESSYRAESCEPNRVPCGRSLAHRDETQISGLNDYAPNNRKTQSTEVGLSSRQHAVNQADSAIILENSRKPVGLRNECGTGSGGSAAGRIKEDIGSGASIKNTTSRFDGVGTGSTVGSNGTSRETPRVPQKETVSPASPGRTDVTQSSASETVRSDKVRQVSDGAKGSGGGSGASGRSFGDVKAASCTPEAGVKNDSATSSSGRGRVQKEDSNSASVRTADRGVADRGSSIQRNDRETNNNSAVSSKADRRTEQASTNRGARNGFNGDAGTAIYLIDSERRNGRLSINTGKLGENLDNTHNDRKSRSFTTELISSIRTFDWQSIGKWVSEIKVSRWIDRLDWKSSAKIASDFGTTRRTDDAWKATDLGLRSGKEFRVCTPARENNNASEQLANVKRTEINRRLDELADVSGVKEAVRIISSSRFAEAAAVISALRPTEALKHFLAMVDAEERKLGVKFESSRTNLQDKSPRQIDRRSELFPIDDRRESGERAKILSLTNKLVPTELENTKRDLGEREALRQYWTMNFSVAERLQDSIQQDEEPVTLKTDTTSGSASSNQQSQSTPAAQTQNRAAYTVQSGETLRSIASRLFGDARIADLIKNLNRELLTSDCALPLRAGIVLWLPNHTEINTFYWSQQSAGLTA